MSLWVVEMLVDEDRWEPTVGSGLTRDNAREEMKRWKEDNPSDRFRLRQYKPADIGGDTR